MSFFLKFHIKKLFFKMFESMIFKIDIKKKIFFLILLIIYQIYKSQNLRKFDLFMRITENFYRFEQTPDI